MKLKRLEIECPYWGPNKGKHIAKVRVGDDTSEILLELDDAATHRILQACAEELVLATERGARELKGKLLSAFQPTHP